MAGSCSRESKGRLADQERKGVPTRWRFHLGAGSALLLLLAGLGCEPEKPSEQEQTAKSQETNPKPAPPKPMPPNPEEKRENPLDSLPEEAKVKAVVNPRDLEPYTGPTGAIRGIVRATGDAPVPNEAALKAIKEGCDLAPKVFGKTFREGEGRALADVLVAATEYEGYVPQPSKEVLVRAEGCAWEARTYALTFGQALMIEGKDRQVYVPELVGQRMPAQLFAMPGGDPVRLPPLEPGRFTLVDSLRLYNVADVLVVPYATFDVTGLDGKFEIEGVPVGEVKVNAFLPIIGAVQEKEITVEEGKTVELQLELNFDASKLEKK